MNSNLWLTALFLNLAISAEYVDDFSRNTMFPLATAAYEGNPAPCITSGTGDGKLVRRITQICDALNETCSGYTALSPQNKAVILSFRGSQGQYEIDLAALDILLGKQLSFPGGALVGDFFYNAFLKLWNGGMKDDFLNLRSKYPDYEIWVTGHSLGGALAGLAAAYITQLSYVPPQQVKLVTFGEPRTGDSAYASLVNKIPYSYRVVHNNDWAPHLPFQVENYQHHSTEIWYPNNMTLTDSFTVCKGNEDKTCSDSLPLSQWNEAAHTLYFNYNMNKYGPQGCVYK